VAALLAGTLAVGCSGPGGDLSPFVTVLGVAQDGGYPQAGCDRTCCRPVWEGKRPEGHVSSLGVVDPSTGQRWLLDATPDLPRQLRALHDLPPTEPRLDGIFLTHAHMGHYTGLMHLGHEAMGADGITVHVMPRMGDFLSSSGPWEQLVRYGNIVLEAMEDGAPVVLNERLTVTPMLVPHRDEYSETVGFRIEGPERAVAYIPDIDKWERWSMELEDLLEGVAVAYVDGTFYDGGELPDRDLSLLLHPFVTDTLERLADASPALRERVRFLHLNHTNPLLDASSEAAGVVRRSGCRVAEEGERVGL
jgi:pyrroloquinoline quinone biosynthesis protein B